MIRSNFQFGILALLAAFSVLSSGCNNSYSSSPKAGDAKREAPEPKQVKTHRVTPTPQEVVVEVDGSLAAHEQATLSTKVAGRMASINVDLGSVVQQSTLLAQIDSRDYQLRVQRAEALLAQARARLGLPLEGTDDRVDVEKTGTIRQTRARLTEAENNRNRVRKLSTQGIISESEQEAAEATYQVALSQHEQAMEEIRNRQATLAERRAELEIAKQELADTSIYAPFDGVIQERRANVGEYLPASTPIVTIVRMNPLRLQIDISERQASRIQEGQKVRVSVEGNTNIYTGKITRLSPALDAQTRVLRVEADINNPGLLRPGSFVRAEIVVNDKVPTIVIPKEALVTFAGMEKIFVVENNVAVERSITTGRRQPDTVEVVSGLKSGDLIVIAPGNLQSGQPIAAVN